MTAPIDPVPLANTAGYIPPAILATYQDFYSIPPKLQALGTEIIYIAPNGSIFHLSGRLEGAEGVRLGENIQGEQQWPFDQVLLEGAYQYGATIVRQVYNKRLINLRVVIGGNNFTNYQFHLCDNRWWEGQDETQDGWLGVRTRFTGWRWDMVRPFKTVDTTLRQDPVAYSNNTAIWDINWICSRPWYAKPALYKTWYANQSGQPNKAGQYTGSVTLANRGDLPTYVQYIINGTGIATVQDNSSASTMVQLPAMIESDGPGLCDTDPITRTLTAANDPVDNEFFNIAKASEVLNFFLTNLDSSNEPWWQRGYVRFNYSVPPQSVTTFNVAHTNPNATIAVLLTQRYKRGR